jgi:integrase
MAVKPTTGGYQVDFRDVNHKRIRKTFEKKKDADNYHEQVRTEVREGTFIRASKATIADKAKEWLERKKKTRGYRYKTLQNWEIHVKKYIIPDLGDLPIQQANIKHIEDASLKWAERTSANTANMVLKTLTAIFFLAQRRGPLDPQGTNVAKLAERIKITTEDDLDGEVLLEDVYTAEQLYALIMATPAGSIIRLIIELAGLCGLRIGEILGFTWPAIDLKAAAPKVRVIKNLVSDEKEKSDFPGYGKTGRSLKDPKSKKSRREIDAPKELVHDLKLWKLKCPQTPQQIVMATTDGVPLQPNAAQDLMDAACEAAEVPRMTLHRLRHTFASLLLLRGEPLINVSQLLGHRDIAITAKVYAHFIPSKNTAVQDLASSVFRGR